jgi:3-phenylpropionate/trans-cinnamate dioxygenase ferredoxin subunit
MNPQADQTGFAASGDEWVGGMAKTCGQEVSLDAAVIFPGGELKDGEKAITVINDTKLLFCKAGGVLFAMGDACPHQGASLAEGKLRGVTITCPRHGARFDLRTGKVLGGSGYPPLQMLPVSLENGKISLRLPTR